LNFCKPVILSKALNLLLLEEKEEISKKEAREIEQRLRLT
jgi:hypothetical protein